MQDMSLAMESNDWAERLRTEFDRTFTEPLKPAAAGIRDFVLVAAGGTQWALALNGLGGIEHGHALVPVPSARTELLGLAGVRNQTVPVFDLAVLLGGSRHEKALLKAPAFALLETGQGQPVGVAFERLLQIARVAREVIYAPASLVSASLASGQASAGHFALQRRATLHHEHEVYAVVEVKELLSRILAPLAGRNGSQKDLSQEAPDGEPAK